MEGIGRKNKTGTPVFVIVQPTLSYILCNHASTSHVYTDELTISTGCVAVPSHRLTETIKRRH
ncbi:MAG: hypothetical protein O7D30_10010 [Rickettsia endosymbiont of Ixodes persulcatus]|nr:hypothetical protein [Rickettsia endosymbiont of Ixodes persulcatus]